MKLLKMYNLHTKILSGENYTSEEMLGIVKGNYNLTPLIFLRSVISAIIQIKDSTLGT